MKTWCCRHLFPILIILLFTVNESPAPLVFTPGEGWSYQAVGSGRDWQKNRARDQYEIANEALQVGDYKLAIKAAKRALNRWPLSDFSARVRLIMAEAYEGRKMDEKAFKEYQKTLNQHPNVKNYEEILERQFDIANRYLQGQRFKLWGRIPWFKSMDKTAQMYQDLIENGPHSKISPQAQLNIGEAREKEAAGFLGNKQEKYNEAIAAYQKAADLYHDNEAIASKALYQAGLTYHIQANSAEYDQSIASKAMEIFSDYLTLYPEDEKKEAIQEMIRDLRREQARGRLEIARYYEKRRNRDGALIYYNAVLQKDPQSDYAETARQKIEELKSSQSTVLD
ncbi:MAG TPA: outer membrane protein assembly factor BamD [Verrucomicrobiales bacterium]|nr:outer membrane protein assembly factor BamD [Verrucomicrobiales bacterium]HIL69860.1 outer membrane protein assembly factor BamD [Verrucomicrobiota bacterium]